MRSFKDRPMRGTRAAQQRGAVALIVVMLLFFVISLVAAYTSRNLIFEQRTASNQYRSTQALEAADAGIEWTLAQLNGGLITTQGCTATTSAAGNQSFRQRYLNIDKDNGNVTPVALSAVGRHPSCVLDTSSAASDWKWSCVCPSATGTFLPLAAPSALGPAPAFVVQMLAIAGRPDLFEAHSYSCTRLSPDCMDFSNANRGGTGDGIATTRVTVALRGALTRVPAAALTVSGTLTTTASALLTLNNSAAAANGVTLHSSGPAPAAGLALNGLPGTRPASTTFTGDNRLAPPAILSPPAATAFSTEDLRFAAFFGMQAQTYKRQPGLPVLDCSAGCNAAAINTAIARNPGRPIWLAGGTGTVTIDGGIGSIADPALLIVEGNVVFASGGSVVGLLYSRIKRDLTLPGNPLTPTVWLLNGNANVEGAAIAEGDLRVDGTASGSITYNAAVLRKLRVGSGTFVRVPGSWRDFS